jgi:thioredoxin reductase (NADPH)
MKLPSHDERHALDAGPPGDAARDGHSGAPRAACPGVGHAAPDAPCTADPIRTDALIVGAGPVGLFQVFELGLLEIRAHVVDSLGAVGGQCSELYPDKPIYDIPALPVVTGAALIDNLLEQARPFAPTFHLGQEVTALQPREDGRFDVETTVGTRFDAGAVIIAGGAGSFQPRLLKLDGIDAFAGSQLHYRVRDPARFDGRHLVILGGGDSALDWALALLDRAGSIVLVHRRDGFRAAPATVAKMKALCEAHRMQYLVGQARGFETDPLRRLSWLKVAGADGVTRRLPLDDLLVFFGLSPRLGPIADWGLSLQQRRLLVDTEKFQTSVPGIFAVGDVNHYPGKKKLILSGFHEAALAAYGVARHLSPQRSLGLQYTTTSTKLHQVLGVPTPTLA